MTRVSASLILRLAAIVVFALAVLGISIRVPAIPLGLLCWSLSTVV